VEDRAGYRLQAHFSFRNFDNLRRKENLDRYSSVVISYYDLTGARSVHDQAAKAIQHKAVQQQTDMAPVEDYYAILEVSQTASATDIKKSYRRLAILRHPDKNHNKPDATALFQLVSISSTNK
jgi:DnaJ-domain-containing protein 1